VFRYPEDIKGNRRLAEHKLINVEVLRDQLKELQEILERFGLAISLR
jgi:RNA-binding protein YhbY